MFSFIYIKTPTWGTEDAVLKILNYEKEEEEFVGPRIIEWKDFLRS
jgi:hypothetical protein